MSDEQREIRHLRKHLKQLSAYTAGFIAQMDRVMKAPATVERGKRIAQLLNSLDVANDCALRFGLRMTSPAIAKLKQPGSKKEESHAQ